MVTLPMTNDLHPRYEEHVDHREGGGGVERGGEERWCSAGGRGRGRKGSRGGAG